MMKDQPISLEEARAHFQEMFADFPFAPVDATSTGKNQALNPGIGIAQHVAGVICDLGSREVRFAVAKEGVPVLVGVRIPTNVDGNDPVRGMILHYSERGGAGKTVLSELAAKPKEGKPELSVSFVQDLDDLRILGEKVFEGFHRLFRGGNDGQ